MFTSASSILKIAPFLILIQLTEIFNIPDMENRCQWTYVIFCADPALSNRQNKHYESYRQWWYICQIIKTSKTSDYETYHSTDQQIITLEKSVFPNWQSKTGPLHNKNNTLEKVTIGLSAFYQLYQNSLKESLMTISYKVLVYISTRPNLHFDQGMDVTQHYSKKYWRLKAIFFNGFK